MIAIENLVKLMMNTRNYKFCILAAGRGTRNTSVAGLHKALLPLENKSVISHIISKVPLEVEIVVAVGHKQEQLISYLDHVHPERKFHYVRVDNYQGPGSGPGYSLLQCREVLQCPFIFTSVDTIIEEDFIFDELRENWIGVSNVDREESSKYCLVNGERYLDNLYYGKGSLAYTGMAGIYDYELYWEALIAHSSEHCEHQVTSGFEGLNKIKMISLTWHDTGNNLSYEKTKRHFSNEVVATKNTEALYIEKGRVIKYFNEPAKVGKRLMRTQYLPSLPPDITRINDNMYSYRYVEGKLLSDILDDQVLQKVLSFYKKEFMSGAQPKTDQFKKDCQMMYYDKTLERIQYFSGSELDKIKFINGVETLPIKELVKGIKWEKIYNNSIPASFHGDFQPENIIYDGSSFKLIDWRDSFGESVSTGDLYYDLGKLYHALLINGQSVLSKEYAYSIDGHTATFQYKIKSNLLFLFDFFESFCKDNDLCWDHVELLGTLQYIGICSLYQKFHNGEYGNFLFLLGKYLLTKKLNYVTP